MVLKADQHDYKRGFEKHYYTCMSGEKICDLSQKLMLVYCVECGLKYCLMKEKRIFNVNGAQEDLKHMLSSHDFEGLLKALSISNYRFPQIETKHGDKATPKTYHQMCRYGICPNNESVMRQYDEQLIQIARKLKERV